MSENTHYTEAQAVGRYYTTRNLDTDAEVIAMGQVEATLALAYEQRTANLIALYSDGSNGPAPDIDYGALVAQIKARLGL